MTDTAFVIFSRFDSRRLPGKALVDLAGRPLLARVIERVRAAAEERPVVVATSARPIDDGIARLAAREGAAVFRGSADDVAGRALACVDAFGLDGLVRICGDSPFVDPGLCRDMVARSRTCGADIVTNVFPRGYPPGCSVEIIRAEAMRRVCAQATEPEHREHVTRYAYEHPDRFRIENVAPKQPFPIVTLTVDTPLDLERARHVFAEASGGIGALDLTAIVALAQGFDRRTR